MPDCWLCGRAMVRDYTDPDDPVTIETGGPLPWSICDRAHCKPERDHLIDRLNHVRMDHWVLISQFDRRGPPPCQTPDCTRAADAETDFTYCPEHTGMEAEQR